MPSAPELFVRRGYAVLERLISRATAGALAAEVRRLDGRLVEGACERPHNTLLPLRWDDPVVGRLLGSRSVVDALRAALAAPDLRWISGYVSIKEARTPALWWHQDWWCWAHPISQRSQPVQVALLCYLAETDARSGALRVIPGSHLRRHPLHAALRDPEAAGRQAIPVPDDPVMTDHPDQLTLTVEPGDALLIDYRLLHGTHPNDGDRRRDCVILNFAPDWGGLPPEIRAHLIRHPALPAPGERGPGTRSADDMLPRYRGKPRDLQLSRLPPPSWSNAR